MTAALRTEGLGKRYGRRMWALRDCTLSLPQGRIIALVGPNGAGKSTLLHLAIGLLKPTEGTVRLFDEPAAMDRPAALAQVGFVAQDHPIYPGFTVADLVHFGRSLNPDWDDEYARRRLDELGIPSRRRAGKLSGGQQAQVALTLALAKRPRLLVLDEPVASLDPVARREFMKALIDAVAGGDLTVLLSSHVVAELERVCDHLILLRAGRVRLAGDIDDMLGSHRLLVGPRGEASPHMEGVITATHGQRHSNLLVRMPADVQPHPRWEPHPVSLEDLVLAYLEQPDVPAEPEPVPATGRKE
jgi:ABC-2 type transport system ATP-binding protein